MINRIARLILFKFGIVEQNVDCTVQLNDMLTLRYDMLDTKTSSLVTHWVWSVLESTHVAHSAFVGNHERQANLSGRHHRKPLRKRLPIEETSDAPQAKNRARHGLGAVTHNGNSPPSKLSTLKNGGW